MSRPTSRRIAVVTADLLSARMAGPAIRAFHIAELLSSTHDVTLISTAACDLDDPRVECRHVPWHGLREALQAAEIVILQGFVTYHAPWLLKSDKILIIDMYDPMHLEQLVQLENQPSAQRWAGVDLTTRVLNDQLVRGDFFLCASEEQRHLWLGQMSALGRINPANYDRDPTMRRLIDICPFGISDTPPARNGPGARNAMPGIGESDKLLLWAGGVYNWFDPVSLIRALDRVRQRHDDVRLLFLGMKHPNPDVPDMQVAWEARQLSDGLGLTGQNVFFREGWVDYADRQNFLLEADAGVSTHPHHVETTFSFRTRLLDYFWAGLPIIATDGDPFGSLIAGERLGVAVGDGDVDGLAAAIAKVLYDNAFAAESRSNVVRVRERFYWSRVLEPLVDFCADPTRAPDVAVDQRRMIRRPVVPSTALGRDVMRGMALLREGGPRLVADRVVARSRRIRAEHRNDQRDEHPDDQRESTPSH